MRGYLNKSNIRMLVIFGVVLLPIINLCYHKKLSLGSISSSSLFLFLILMLVGSTIEIPVTKMRTKKPEHLSRDALLLDEIYGVSVLQEVAQEKRRIFDTVITLNLGGFVIPLLMVLYLSLTQPDTAAFEIMLIIVLFVSLLAEMVSGVGIVVPDYIGLISIPFALILSPQNAAVVIFISSTGGILIGIIATLLTLNKEKKGSAYINLGGAGSFKAVYVTTLIASLISYFT
ncbi:MAG: DUF1614 domain-containing protein [Methanosarcinaceae archaeon]|nr:DUF1614 domain-containing protein [Methanosarcinaceae archaeon]